MRCGPYSLEFDGFFVMAHIAATGNGFTIALQQMETAKWRRKHLRGIAQNFTARPARPIQIRITAIIFMNQTVNKRLCGRVQKRRLDDNINHRKPPLKQILSNLCCVEAKAAIEQGLL